MRTLNRKTRKILTMYGAFHPKSDVDERRRRLISYKGCVRSEENILGLYVKNAEDLLRGFKATEVIDYKQSVESEEFKKALHEEKSRNWKGKHMEG